MDPGEPQPMEAEWGQSKTKLMSIFSVVYTRALTFAVSKKCSDFGRNRTNFALDLAP
jgi:hypothetical protein